MTIYIAHKNQELHEHLEGVAELAKIHAGKIGIENYGELLGLLHDFGKYSSEFQKYISDAIKKGDRSSIRMKTKTSKTQRERKARLTTLPPALSFFLAKTVCPMPIKYLRSFSLFVWYRIIRD